LGILLRLVPFVKQYFPDAVIHLDKRVELRPYPL
jgi:hypothetical protein